MRRFISVFVLCIAAVGLSRPAGALDPTSLSRARHLVHKGRSALAKGRATRAEKLFREAIEIEPALPTAYAGLAAALVQQKRFGKALPVARQAEEKFVAFQKKVQQAQVQDRALRSGPLAATASQAGSATGAPDIERQLTTRRWTKVEKDPVPSEVYYLEGLCELRTGQRRRGIEDLETCLRKNPKHGLAHYNLSVALFLGGDLQGAKRHLDRALALGVKANPMFVQDLNARLSH
jgi:Tfp pilus assembly protein PilF